MKIHRITLDTRNFHFETYGETEAQARAAMEYTLLAHARQYKLSPDWSDDMEVEHYEFDLGHGYRDREKLFHGHA